MYNMNNVEELKISIKQNIKLLIEKNMFYEANTLLEQLKKIAPNDTELYAMQAAIALAENHLEQAEELLQTGLQYNAQDPNLLFHFACLMEKKHEWEEATFYYKNASAYTDDIQLKENIVRLLSNVNKNMGINNKEKNNLKVIHSTPKVSVIVAAYNMKDYLKECVDSILRQDYNNLEVIVADDCSTDGTKEMMEQYINDPKVRYVRNKVNLGSKKNGRQLLYNLADGKYVLVVNHDDYLIQNNYITKAVTLLEENPHVSLVFANLKILYAHSGKFEYTTVNIPKFTNGIDYFLNYETMRYPHITSVLTSLFRREQAIQMQCFLEESDCQDLFLYLKLMLVGDIAFIEDFVGVYRVHENSLSFNMPKETDYSTVVELEKLQIYALEKGLNPTKLKEWLDYRVYSFIQWRFSTMWQQDRKNALQLLMSISDKYPTAFNWIVDFLQIK